MTCVFQLCSYMHAVVGTLDMFEEMPCEDASHGSEVRGEKKHTHTHTEHEIQFVCASGGRQRHGPTFRGAAASIVEARHEGRLTSP